LKTVGLVLVVLGVLALVYGGINYNKNRTVLQMGSVKVTATEHKTIPVPAIAGGAALIGGAALFVFGRRKT
jgi:LPXTG-motif cell wall-anchored protein